MSELKIKDIIEFREFVKWKKENPEEYKEFWKDLKEVMKDLMKVAKELSEEME